MTSICLDCPDQGHCECIAIEVGPGEWECFSLKVDPEEGEP